MGVHWFDTWRHLFGTPNRLYSETLRESPYIKGEDSGIVVLGYDDFYGILDMSWATRRKLDRSAWQRRRSRSSRATKHRRRGGDANHVHVRTIALVNKEGTVEETMGRKRELDHEQGHFLLQSHFIDSLNSGLPFQTEGADNLITLKMAFGVYESAASHMPIPIKGD